MGAVQGESAFQLVILGLSRCLSLMYDSSPHHIKNAPTLSVFKSDYYYYYSLSPANSALLGFFLLLATVKLRSALPLEHCGAWVFLAKV